MKSPIQFIHWKVLTLNPEQIKQNKHSTTPTFLFQHLVICLGTVLGNIGIWRKRKYMLVTC
jgi:hypothetical protein